MKNTIDNILEENEEVLFEASKNKKLYFKVLFFDFCMIIFWFIQSQRDHNSILAFAAFTYLLMLFNDFYEYNFAKLYLTNKRILVKSLFSTRMKLKEIQFSDIKSVKTVQNFPIYDIYLSGKSRGICAKFLNKPELFQSKFLEIHPECKIINELHQTRKLIVALISGIVVSLIIYFVLKHFN